MCSRLKRTPSFCLEIMVIMDLTNQLILADLLLLIYLVKVKTTRQIFSNYVCFSKSPNFKFAGLTKLAVLWCFAYSALEQPHQKLGG